MTVIDNMQASDESIAAGNGVLGQRMLRKEDPSLLTGEAVFTNDMKVPGALHLAVLRSPYAHARIVSVDVSASAESGRALGAGPMSPVKRQGSAVIALGHST